VCVDVAGRPPILISQRSDSKSATDYTSCISGEDGCRLDAVESARSMVWLAARPSKAPPAPLRSPLTAEPETSLDRSSGGRDEWSPRQTYVCVANNVYDLVSVRKIGKLRTT
jgi:hypothetical protein